MEQNLAVNLAVLFDMGQEVDLCVSVVTAILETFKSLNIKSIILLPSKHASSCTASEVSHLNSSRRACLSTLHSTCPLRSSKNRR